MKKCSICKQLKSNKFFYFNAVSKNKLTSECRLCIQHRHKYYYKHPEVKKRIKQRAKEYNAAIAGLIKFIKRSLPCLNCKKYFKSEVMQLDHIILRHTSKQPYRRGIVSMIKELHKLRILCSNCHSLRTSQQRKNKWGLSR